MRVRIPFGSPDFMSMWTRGLSRRFLKPVIAGSNPAIDAKFLGISASGRRSGFQSQNPGSIPGIPTKFGAHSEVALNSPLKRDMPGSSPGRRTNFGAVA